MEIIRLWTQRLSVEYDHLCFTYNLKLKKPVIRISTHSSIWGRWDPETRTLEISKQLIERVPWFCVIEILKHEMAHQWVSEILRIEDGHGPQFHRACDLLAVSYWARRAESEIIVDETIGNPSFTEGTLDNEAQRLLRRVEKLLALANSSNEHEAFLAMQKVQELYAKYNLERLSRHSNASSFNYSYYLINTGRKRLERHFYSIASILNDYFFVEVLHTSTFDAKTCSELRVIELMGTKENLRMAEYVYHFLLNQLPLLWEGYSKTNSLSSRSRKSYYLGVLSGFRKKLQNLDSSKNHSSAQNHLSTSIVVPVDHGLKQYFSNRYPKTNLIRQTAVSGDPNAYSAGQVDGSNLSLRRGLDSHSSSRSPIKGLLNP